MKVEVDRRIFFDLFLNVLIIVWVKLIEFKVYFLICSSDFF